MNNKNPQPRLRIPQAKTKNQNQTIMKLSQSAPKHRNLKTSILFFASLFFLVTTTSNQANANMFKKKGFYFEKYSNSEEAREALLKLHPVGSGVWELMKTLEGFGFKCEMKKDNVHRNLEESNSRYQWCVYSSKAGYINVWVWNDDSGYWNNSSNSLKNLVINYYPSTKGGFIIHPILSAISAFNHLRGGFRFEKYSTAKSAEESLLAIHPIGSEVRDLIKTIKKTGAKCFITDWKINTKQTDPLSSTKSLSIKDVILKPEDGYICFYEEPELIFSTSWVVNVYINPANWRIIKTIKVNSNYNYL